MEPDESAFGGIFNTWRFLRVKKLENVLGKEWFSKKKILELGCAYGNVGHYFSLLGSDVTFSDIREKALDKVKSKNSSFKTIKIDQESKWKIEDHYDLIIHFGISYNLNYWERDLITTLSHGDIIAYETAVTKYSSDAEYKIVSYNYTSDEHGPSGNIGSLVSSSNIESVFLEQKVDFKRYDDSDLNTDSIYYDWNEVPFDAEERTGIVKSWWNNPHYLGRRYWIVRR
jgi:SAM-dependent methyltransferase